MSLRTGLDRVLADPSLLPEGPFALCTNYAAVTADLARGVDALHGAGLPVTALLTPEHGYWGAAQAGASEGDGTDAATQISVLDTHRVRGADLDALLGRCGAGQVAVDLQDIGTRFYTYMWSLYELLCAAARTGHRVIVLDRPNPLGGRRAGPGLEARCSSPVGRLSIPLQHGLSLGELARWFNTAHVPKAAGRSAELRVIAMEGWLRESPAGSERWVMPSPNMPTLETAVLYPGTGLIEGTSLSEGRGTTRPFELLGAPWMDGRWAAALRERDLPGLAVREAVFRPTFSKHAGETTAGIQLHLTDPAAYDPVATAYSLLSTVAELWPEQPLWLERFADDRPPFIDLLWGSSAFRMGIDAGKDLAAILEESPAAPEPPVEALLYPAPPTSSGL